MGQYKTCAHFGGKLLFQETQVIQTHKRLKNPPFIRTKTQIFGVNELNDDK